MLVIYENPGFEHSIASILLFQEDDTAPYWSDALYYFYPHIDKEKMLSISITERGQYLTEVLRNVWDDLSKELDQKVELYNLHFNRYHAQIEDALSEAFEMDTSSTFNDLKAYITLNPVCPRFLKEKYFDVFIKTANGEHWACLFMKLYIIFGFMYGIITLETTMRNMISLL